MPTANPPRSQRFDPAAEPPAGTTEPALDLPADNGGTGNFFADYDAEQARVVEQDQAHHTLAAMLAGAKSLAPLLEAVAVHPGVHQPVDVLRDAVDHMLSASEQIAERAMATLEIADTPGNAWAKSQLTQLAVAGVATQWREAGHADPAAWLGIIDNVVNAGVVGRQSPYPDVTQQTAFQVSHFAALSTLAAEIQRFNFHIEPTALLEYVSKHLSHEVHNAVDTVLDGVPASDADRVMVEQGMLKHGSGLYAQIYRAEAERTQLELGRMTPADRQQFMRERGPSERIKAINRTFGSLFAKLTETSRQRAVESVQRQPKGRAAPGMN